MVLSFIVYCLDYWTFDTDFVELICKSYLAYGSSMWASNA